MTDAAAAVSGKPAYHHGDLRAALLVAAETELVGRGIEAFSLRRVALRARVSHAAPAHHFGDTRGLLTALAAVGFGRFLAVQRRREEGAGADPRDRLVAAGLGYVDFAMAHPALLRLMFGSDRTDYANADLKASAGTAYAHLSDLVRDAGGGAADETATWAMVHGLADLTASGRLKPLVALEPAARDDALRAMIRRALPTPA